MRSSRSAEPHPGTDVRLLVHDLHITVIDAATGELLRQLVLDPTRVYQPTGRPPGPHSEGRTYNYVGPAIPMP